MVVFFFKNIKKSPSMAMYDVIAKYIAILTCGTYNMPQWLEKVVAHNVSFVDQLWFLTLLLYGVTVRKSKTFMDTLGQGIFQEKPKLQCKKSVTSKDIGLPVPGYITLSSGQHPPTSWKESSKICMHLVFGFQSPADPMKRKQKDFYVAN